MVFFYQSGQGIVAYGLAFGILETAQCGNGLDGEHFQQFTSFQQLKAPMSAAKMKKVVDHGFPFRTTMFSICGEDRECFWLKSNGTISKANCQMEWV